MTQVVECPRHPGIETALRCSRCEAVICPSCLVHTPIGARCHDCARIVRPPMYVLSSRQLLQAGAASVGGGLTMGLVWGLILLPFTFGFFSIVIGAGLGYLFTRLMELATGGKRGPIMVSFAVGGIFIAWSLHILFTDLRFSLWGLMAAGIGMYFAYRSLR